MNKRIILAGGGRVYENCKRTIETYFGEDLYNPPINLFLKEIKRGENIESCEKGDIIISAGYDVKVNQTILEKALCVNVHLSKLPDYRGSNIFYWGIRNDERVWGVTLHKMSERIDMGDIICQRVFEVFENDTAGTLYERAVEHARNMFAEEFPNLLTGNFKLKKQKEKGVFYYKDRIDFNSPVLIKDKELRARLIKGKSVRIMVGGSFYELNGK